jgi:haloalkane dehalogenase
VLIQLDLTNTTLVCQDWGGLIGLRLRAENNDRFDSAVVASTMLPTGDKPASAVFMNWLKFSQEVASFPVGKIIKGANVTDIADDVLAPMLHRTQMEAIKKAHANS